MRRAESRVQPRHLPRWRDFLDGGAILSVLFCFAISFHGFLIRCSKRFILTTNRVDLVCPFFSFLFFFFFSRRTFQYI